MLGGGEPVVVGCVCVCGFVAESVHVHVLVKNETLPACAECCSLLSRSPVGSKNAVQIAVQFDSFSYSRHIHVFS